MYSRVKQKSKDSMKESNKESAMQPKKLETRIRLGLQPRYFLKKKRSKKTLRKIEAGLKQAKDLSRERWG